MAPCKAFRNYHAEIRRMRTITHRQHFAHGSRLSYSARVNQTVTSDQLQRLSKIARDRGLPLMMLFGSRGRGTPNRGSDWDIAVVVASQWSPRQHLELLSALEAVLGGTVDMVRLTASTDPVLLRQVFGADGRCLFELTPGAIHSWRSLAARIYADHLIVQRRHQQELRSKTAHPTKGGDDVP
jgi:predicted nucleotidyltransferase